MVDKIEEMGNELQLTKASVRSAVWEKSGGLCWYCGIQTIPWKTFCIDHLIPQSSGGSSMMENLFPCCRWCNSVKSNGDLEQLRTHLRKRDTEYKDIPVGHIQLLEKNGVDLGLDPYTFYFENIENEQ